MSRLCTFMGFYFRLFVDAFLPEDRAEYSNRSIIRSYGLWKTISIHFVFKILGESLRDGLPLNNNDNNCLYIVVAGFCCCCFCFCFCLIDSILSPSLYSALWTLDSGHIIIIRFPKLQKALLEERNS